MGDKDFEQPNGSEPGDEVRPDAKGSEADASGPAAQADGASDADKPEGGAAEGREGEAGEPAGDDTAAVSEGESAETGVEGDNAPDDDGLTIDDILGAEQTDEAAVAEKTDYETQLLNDLKRLQAEYANYRRRTEEQREVEISRAKGEAAKGLLPVLDDLDRAEKHGDLEEGTAFAAIGEKVRAVVERMGIIAYGEAGETFDPQQHEAILQQPTPGATETTVLEVVEVGYRLGDVELRPAKVVVAVPAE